MQILPFLGLLNIFVVLDTPPNPALILEAACSTTASSSHHASSGFVVSLSVTVTLCAF